MYYLLPIKTYKTIKETWKKKFMTYISKPSDLYRLSSVSLDTNSFKIEYNNISNLISL